MRLYRIFHVIRDSLTPLNVRFQRIYSEGRWSGGGEETRSGAGSTLAATAELRDRLPGLLKQLGARSLMDVGCGDFNWMKEVALPVTYLGIDIVEDVISQNKADHSSSSVAFECVDAVTGPLPKGFDVVLCREVLFHLSFRDGMKVLQNIRDSGARYLLATTNFNIKNDKDIVSGGFRNLNLQETPFNFPEPDIIVDDSAVSEGRQIGLWALSDI